MEDAIFLVKKESEQYFKNTLNRKFKKWKAYYFETDNCQDNLIKIKLKKPNNNFIDILYELANNEFCSFEKKGIILICYIDYDGFVWNDFKYR